MRIVKTNNPEQEASYIPLPHIETQTADLPELANSSQRKIALPTMDGIHFEKIQEITCLEAQGNYTLLYFNDKRQLLVCKTLQHIEQMLGNSLQFVRVHRSFTINLNQLQRYVRGKGGYVIMENGSHVNVSSGKKQAFLDTVQLYFGG